MRKFIYILFLVILVSCDIFDSRDPEPPDTGRSNFIAATTREILFQNLVNSLQEKVLENYMACFVDSAFLNRTFKFVPSAGSSSQFSVLANWSLDSESQYFTNVRSNTLENSPIILNLSNEVSNIQSDSAFYQFDYILTVPLADESKDGIYRGSLQFAIQLDSRKQWVIIEWKDIKKEDMQSWSELKGFYY